MMMMKAYMNKSERRFFRKQIGKKLKSIQKELDVCSREFKRIRRIESFKEEVVQTFQIKIRSIKKRVDEIDSSLVSPTATERSRTPEFYEPGYEGPGKNWRKTTHSTTI
jgi:hypothetical protein